MVKFVEKDKDVKHERIFHYDVVILGGGPAGLTSAIYGARYGLDTAVITIDIGGAANLAHKIENYPGFEGSGYDLMQKFHKQAVKYGAKFLHEEITEVYKDDNGFVIDTKLGKQIHTKTIIIALGTEKRKLDIPGEKEFAGKGVSYCVTCDGAFFKDKIVAVIGGGNAACGAALMLSQIAKKVYLTYRKGELKCEKINRDKIKNVDKIKVIYNAFPKEIKGNNLVEEFVYEQKSKEKKLKVDGVFVEIGSIPVTFVAQKLNIKVDDKGYLKVDEEMETSVKGVFAAGDAVKSRLKQVVVAASQGAIATRSAYEHIKNKE